MLKLGKNCKLYYSLTDLTTGAVWVEIPRAVDVNVPLTKDETEVEDRSVDWTGILTSFTKGELGFRLNKDAATTVYTDLRDAFLNDTNLAMAVADGDITVAGTQVFQAEMKMTAFPWNQPLKEVEHHEITLKPAANATVEPDIVVVT